MLSSIARHRLVALAVTLFVCGCIPSLKENRPRDPSRNLPASFGRDPAQTTLAPSQAASLAQKRWQELFKSAELRALIEPALSGNQELNLRVQEVIIARSEVSARGGEVYPKVTAGVGVGIEKVGKYTSQGKSDEAHDVPEHLPDFTFGLRASWEIDILKKLRNAVKAADLRYLASIEAKNFVLTQIVAEIARSYYELIAIDNQLAILKRNIDIQSNALEVVKLEKQAARVTELAVQRFEAEVLKNRSRLYDLQQQTVQAENRINFLLGRFPQPVKRNAEDLNAPLPDGLQAGLPAELLENRPDVRQAELQLAAAKLDVKVAKAAFFPSLTIDAAVGYRAFNPAHLVDTPASLLYSVAAGLTAPLLNRAAISAEYRSANARQLQAVFGYERTVLQAFTDVINQMATIENLQKSYDLQSQQVATLARASEVSGVLFRSARADYMEVLLTRRDSLDAEMELIERKKNQFSALVGIYQTLGGGWRP